ncbi:helix-turn-helix transcriptional regulator [Comamonas sp. NoAH]|uniref:helix-turn-helix transcriptional regulator n=1 Tax=Comamonas halotolerans TaxID=3041496 RepID=UPI0024E0A802|nr:AlpA family phage regulatory protein [Comamonas sp. NoAH]
MVSTLSAAQAFETLADSAYIRERDLVTQPHRKGTVGLLPFSASTLRRKVSAGEFPKPQKLGVRISAWKVADIRAWMAQQKA